IRCAIPPHLCNTGLYSIHARIVILSARWIVQADDVLQFEIKNSGGVGGHYGQPRPGVVRPAAEWTWEPAALDGQQTTRDALVR
ncbi:MAG: hypothetical protein H0T39_02930, partial [Actinobacteria bacterium]|nr:hypothetical protein [Actinomycetota bacterium]